MAEHVELPILPNEAGTNIFKYPEKKENLVKAQTKVH